MGGQVKQEKFGFRNPISDIFLPAHNLYPSNVNQKSLKQLLYMFFLNKRSNFEEKKPHELSYRPNIALKSRSR